ncbi:MAG: hypothetical protein ACW96S_01825 [Promethearchaeota archaeon]|jgi:2-polyprenyl-3-methyl-5-hydroxy-6-metoxy-1,4-benzoquinol methylase
MEYIIKSKNLPNNPELLSSINSAATRLFNKLKNLDIDNLTVSEYIKNYFRKLVGNLKGTIQKYCHLLSLILAKNQKALEDFIFVDYGGGTGIFSLLAKELGIGTVIYNDIYSISCHDANEIAKSIGNSAQEYICGEIHDIIDYCNKKSIQCDALGSYNVIEHIYNIEEFLHHLRLLSQNNLVIVLGTGANPFNPVLKRIITKHHSKREFVTREREFGHKEGDSLEAYVTIRKKMITKYAKKDLEKSKLDHLIRVTRGLREPDIKKCVQNYLDTGNLLKTPDSKFPTNTCDPHSGNWAERLMNPFDLVEILKKDGFKSKMEIGVYGSHSQTLYNVIGKFANILINLIPQKAIYFAPYYILYGFKE